MDYRRLPWVEKYRPQRLCEMCSHGSIMETLGRFLSSKKLPHLLFYGPPGTGKTTAILACARELFGISYSGSVLELNASDDRGIDVVRDQIKTFASTGNVYKSMLDTQNSQDVVNNDENHINTNTERPGFKLIILDEADFMTSSAQDALKRVIELYVKNARFCLICNDLGKINTAIQSRCTLLKFYPLQREDLILRLDFIAGQENIQITESGKEALVSVSCGDMRRLINTLQSVSVETAQIDEDVVYEAVIMPSPLRISEIAHILLNTEFDVAYDVLRRLVAENNYSLSDILLSIFNHIQGADLQDVQKIYLLDSLSKLEQYMAYSGDDKIFLGSLVGIFQLVRGFS